MKDVVFNLNSYIKSIKSATRSTDLQPLLTFAFNETEFGFLKIIAERVPCATIAVFMLEKTFISIGAEYVNVLKKLGLKPVCITFDEQVKFTTDEVCKLFNLHENVRAVTVCDSALFDTALYFATVKNIPIFLRVNNFCALNALKRKTVIKNGEYLDVVTLNAERHVIINKSILQDNVGDFFPRYATRKNVALIDYGVHCALSDVQTDIGIIDEVKGYLKDITAGEQASKKELIELCLRIEVADYFQNGELFFYSSARAVEYLMNGTFGVDEQKEYCAAETYLTLLKQMLADDKNDLLSQVDYVKAAEKVCFITGQGQNQVLMGVKEKLKKISDKKDEIDSIVKVINKHIVEIEKVYFRTTKIQSQILKELKNYVLLSGILTFSENAITILMN